jgi:hypothetical protein
MVTSGKLNQLITLYRGNHYLPDELLLAHALTPLADECGLGGVSIRERVAPVRGVVPLTGEKLDEPTAVLAEHARGASLEMLTIKLSSADLLRLLAAVPHTAVRDAAIYDLLFRQADRHAENVFVTDDGYFKLIDSRDSALQDSLDSLFFASTVVHERNRVGNEHLYKRDTPPVSHHWPQNTLDYRCHVAGGKLGTTLPPAVRKCVAKFASMTPDEVVQAYFADGLRAVAPIDDVTRMKVAAKARDRAAALVEQAKLLRDYGMRPHTCHHTSP